MAQLRRFEHSLPMLLSRAREVVTGDFSAALREYGLSLQQWRVLRALAATSGLDATALSESSGLLTPSLSRIMHNLESRGLITRSASPDDLRRTQVALTTEGRRLFDRVAPLSEARYQDIIDRFGFGKLELLYELLEEFIDKVSDEGER
jgi:homoprotocatechuate degradation regulator HpaR